MWARLGGHAFPVDDATRVRQRRGRLTKGEITITGADYNQLSTAFSQNGHSQLIWAQADIFGLFSIIVGPKGRMFSGRYS